jgi:hypothetical protein
VSSPSSALLTGFFGLRWQAQRDAALLSYASRAFAHQPTINPIEDTSPREKRRRRYALPAHSKMRRHWIANSLSFILLLLVRVRRPLREAPVSGL